MKQRTKPKYNIAQNVWWMVKIAWKTRKRVLFFCVTMAAFEILYNLTQLYIAPEILSRVERHAALGKLLGTISFFTLALFLTMGLKDYLKQIAMFPRVDVRSAIIGMIAQKCNMTSFPNTLDARFLKLREKSHLTCDSNGSPAEHIWQTLTELMQNVGGFVVYLTILSRLEPVLLLVVIATCVVGFLAARYSSSWIFKHRDDEGVYYAKKRHIRNKAESVELAKDIRIFGLQDWMNDLLDSVHNVYLDYRLRCEKVKLIWWMPVLAIGCSSCPRDWTPICTGILPRKVWRFPAARRRKLPLPGLSTRMLPSSFWTSPLLPWTPLPRQRFTAGSMTLPETRLPYTSATGCPAASSATKSRCSRMAGLSSRAPMRHCFGMKRASITGSGMLRHSIIKQMNNNSHRRSSFGG